MAAKGNEAPADEEEKKEGAAEGGEGVDLPKKKIAGKKLILIIVAAVVLLLGGLGAAAYFMGMFGPKEEVAAEEGHGEAKKEASAHGGGHGEGHGEEASGAPVYMEVPALIVNLNTTGRRPVYFKVRVSLELAKEEDKTAVTAGMPRINDGLQTYLRELSPDELQGSAGLLRLREELMLRINAILAPVVVKDILFQEILPQ